MSNRRGIMITLYLSFFVLGLAVPLLGVTVSDLTARFDMPVENGGLFSTVMSLGVIIASAIAGRLYDRVNARAILPVGTAVIGVALLGEYFARTPLAGLGCALLLGVGFGVFMIGPNILVARLNPGNAAGPLNALNVAFGVGAIIAPQLVTLGALLGAVRLAYVFAGIAEMLITVPLALVNVAPPAASETGGWARLNYVAMIPFVVLFFCGMSMEVSFNTWVVTQLQKAAQATLPVANFAASMFWVGYTLSRAVAAWLGRRIHAARLLMIAVGALGAGIALMLTIPASQQVATASAFIVGVGAGPLFPTNMALASVAFPRSFGQVMGLLSAISNIGPMAIPWLQGQIGAGQDGGMEMILVLALVLMGMAVYVERRKPGAMEAGETT